MNLANCQVGSTGHCHLLVLARITRLLTRRFRFRYNVQFTLSALPVLRRNDRRDQAVWRRRQTPFLLVSRVGRRLSVFQRTAFGSRSTGFVNYLPRNLLPSLINF